jgi:hypothetical protein
LQQQVWLPNVVRSVFVHCQGGEVQNVARPRFIHHACLPAAAVALKDQLN